MTIEITTHELDDPDPEDELDLLEEVIPLEIANIPKVTTNLGSAFGGSQQQLGYRVVLGRSREEIVAGLRLICDLGVALFQRGSVGPDVTVTLSIAGTVVEVVGGVSSYNSAPRWARAVGAAMTLRDRAALESLCSFDVGSFEGSYDAYHDLYAQAVIAFVHGRGAVETLLEQAAASADHATVFPERGRRLGVPLIAVARAVMLMDAEAFNPRLAEGLEWYRTLHRRAPDNHDAAAVIPLQYLGWCALAHDRGVASEIESGYIPSWLVDGSFREA